MLRGAAWGCVGRRCTDSSHRPPRRAQFPARRGAVRARDVHPEPPAGQHVERFARLNLKHGAFQLNPQTDILDPFFFLLLEDAMLSMVYENMKNSQL